MLGEQKQTFFTVKDVPAKEFIDALANYLKKNNFIERPTWIDIVKTGTRTYFNIQSRSTLPSMTIGYTSESLPSPEKSTCAPIPVSDSSPTCTVVATEETARASSTTTPPPKSSDGDFSNSRS
jgi:hypothetical protein